MLLPKRDLASRARPFVIEAVRQRYQQTTQFLYLGGIVHEDADLTVNIKRRFRLTRACYKLFGLEQYNMPTARLSLKIRLLKTKAIEALMYGCVTWTLNATHYDELGKARLEVLRRLPGFQRRADHTSL